jgi:membrane protein involved in colicin uptake
MRANPSSYVNQYDPASDSAFNSVQKNYKASPEAEQAAAEAYLARRAAADEARTEAARQAESDSAKASAEAGAASMQSPGASATDSGSTTAGSSAAGEDGDIFTNLYDEAILKVGYLKYLVKETT